MKYFIAASATAGGDSGPAHIRYSGSDSTLQRNEHVNRSLDAKHLIMPPTDSIASGKSSVQASPVPLGA